MNIDMLALKLMVKRYQKAAKQKANLLIRSEAEVASAY